MDMLISLLKSIVLTAVCYMGYPIIRIVIGCGKLEKTRAKKIALWNSIVVGIVFCVLTIQMDANATWNVAPAIFYYWANCKLLTAKEVDSSIEKKQQVNSRALTISEKEHSKDKYRNEHFNGSDLRYVPPVVSTSTTQSKIMSAENSITKAAIHPMFCTECGSRLLPNAKFCGECGTKVYSKNDLK